MAEDGAPPAVTADSMEAKVSAAMLSRFPYFKEQAELITLDSVRRLLEEDLGLDTYALDAHKQLVERCFLECLESADKDKDGEVASSTEKERADIIETVKESKDPDSGGDDQVEDSRVMEKSKTETKITENTGSTVPSEAVIKMVALKRLPRYRKNSRYITVAGARRMLEELILGKSALGPLKKLEKVSPNPQCSKSLTSDEESESEFEDDEESESEFEDDEVSPAEPPGSMHVPIPTQAHAVPPFMPVFPFLNRFPIPLIAFLRAYQNVVGDGNCGYRALAVCLGHPRYGHGGPPSYGYGENHWPSVRANIYRELILHMDDTYSQVMQEDARMSLLCKIAHYNGPASEDHRFETDCALVAASAYYAVVVRLSDTGDSMTYLPMRRDLPMPSIPQAELWIFSLTVSQGVHYMALTMFLGSPLPPLDPRWATNRHASVAHLLPHYKSRFRSWARVHGLE